jgi:hypothetical protein
VLGLPLLFRGVAAFVSLWHGRVGFEGSRSQRALESGDIVRETGRRFPRWVRERGFRPERSASLILRIQCLSRLT